MRGRWVVVTVVICLLSWFIPRWWLPLEGSVATVETVFKYLMTAIAIPCVGFWLMGLMNGQSERDDRLDDC